MPRVQHFEICANDPEKIASFYEKVLGWKVTKWEGLLAYWLVETGEFEEPGIDGGISRPNEVLSGTVNTIGVDDIDAYLEKVNQFGGESCCREARYPWSGVQCLLPGC